MLTLVTPTGDRPEAFALCEYWMSRQTYDGDIQWIVVDDGQQPTCCTAGQDYVRREPHKKDPDHTLGFNLKAAMPHVRGDRLLIIEDDDYYSSRYIEIMMSWLDQAELVGECGARYYYLKDRAYYFWGDHQHASLCRTGMRGRAIEVLKSIVNRSRGDWKIDLRLWESFRGLTKLVEADIDGSAMCVGIKQMPGRAGVTYRRYGQSRLDPAGRKLKEWTGNDYRCYRRYAVEQTTIYTCLFGDYDQIPDPVGVIVTDDPDKAKAAGWREIIFKPVDGTSKRTSRFWKMHPHLLFQNSSTLYVDANVRFKSDPQDLVRHMAAQSCDLVMFRHNRSKTVGEEVQNAHRLLGIGKHQLTNDRVQSVLSDPIGWAGCIYRSASPAVVECGEIWWESFADGLARDQMALPYAIRESGVSFALLSEDTPFFGGQSSWVSVRNHRLKRMVY